MFRKYFKTNILSFFFQKKNFFQTKNGPLNTNNKIFSNPNLNFPLFNLSKQSFVQQEKTYKDVLKDYQENKQKVGELINNFNKELNSNLMSNEDKLFSKLEEINSFPVSLYEFQEFRQKLVENIPNFNLKRNNSINTLFSLLEKLEVDENLDKTLSLLSGKIYDNIKTYDPETISVVIYTYSKGRTKDQNLWNLFENIVLDKLTQFDLRQLSQILISFTMTVHRSTELYTKMVKHIEKNLVGLTHLDNSRICFSLTRGIVPLRHVSEETYKKLQDNFTDNVSQFNLFQISKILLLFSEVPIYNKNLFSNAEMEISKEYLNQIDEILRENSDGTNLKAFLDDLTSSMLTFSIKRKGSKFFWTSYLKCIIRLKDHITIESLENLLFITVQVAEMNNIYDITKDADMNNVIEMLQTKIIKENLLKENKINPFNLMMCLSTLRIGNNELWGDLLVNVLKAVKHENFKVNAFIISDLAYAFGTYETALINNSKPHELYEKNRDELWNFAEKHFNSLKPEDFDVLQIANIAWYFSQIGFGNNTTWDNIQKLTFVHLNNFDQYNYLLLCMGLSTMDINNTELWRKLEEKGLSMINNFSLEDLRKLIFSFIKVKECKKIWENIGEVLASDRIMAEFNLGNFFDLQLPLAVTEVKNPKIWQKFEEIVFKNMNVFESDNDALMNTVYSFSKVGKGTPLLWNKFTEIVRNRLDTYDAEDLGHVAICMNKVVQDKVFWEKFLVAVKG